MPNVHHSNEDNPCLACIGKLKQTHPTLADWYNRLKAEFPNVHISWSYRGMKDQNAMFDAGKSKLQYPLSAHNATVDGVPMSKALDLFSLSEDGVALFPPLYYAKIWNWCQENKEPIKWGGFFKTLGDSDHFQLS